MLSGSAPQPVSRLQRRVQPVPPLPARRRSQVRRLEAVRAHRSPLHEAVPRDDEPRRAGRGRREPVDGISQAQTGVAKLDYARVVAAALAYLIAGQGDAVGLVGLRRDACASTCRAVPARSHLRACSRRWRRCRRRARRRRRASLRRSVDLLSRRGLLILISGSLRREEAVEAELRRAVRMGHEVAVFHVLTRDELEFPVRRRSGARGSRVGTARADRVGGAAPAIATRSPSSSSAGMRAARAIASTTRAS